MDFTPKFSVSLVEQITEFLTNAIIEGKFQGGQRLVENELQRRFGISRGPIRESFRILERKGLIVNVPRKGTFVKKITRKDVEENFPIRAYLEGLAARLAVSNLGSKDIEAMESAYSKMTEESKKNNFRSYFKYHSDFHEIFIYGSNNGTLIGILENLRQQSTWFRFSYQAVTYVQEFLEYVISTHRDILELFIKRDADRVETLVKEHIVTASKRFLEFIEQ